MSKIVCIDPGHGGEDSGATFRDLKEKDVTLRIAKNILDIFSEKDYIEMYWGFKDVKIILTRYEDIYVSLPDRCKIANDANAKIFVSIHCNADPDPDLPGMPEARGEEIWYYEGSDKGKKLAALMADAVDSFFPDDPFRGIKPTKNLYVLKHTKMPAILIEAGFIDNCKTYESFKDELSLVAIAQATLLGISDYFDVVGEG